MSLTKVSYSMITGAVVNVLDYGPNTVPGTTDMTPVIQAALDSLIGGGELFFPAGTYRLNSGLTLPNVSGITLKGASQNSSALKYYGIGTAIKKFDQTNPTYSTIIDSLYIENTGLVGLVGVDFTSSWKGKIQNCNIVNFPKAIYITDGPLGTYWNRISSNFIYSPSSVMTHGIHLYATGVGVNQNWIRENVIKDALDYGIFGQTATYTMMVNNTIDSNDIETMGSTGYFVNYNGQASLVSGNWFDGGGGTQIGLYLTGIRNTARNNTYAGSFGGATYSISSSNEINEPDRVTAQTDLSWTFLNDLNAEVGIFTAKGNVTPATGVLTNLFPVNTGAGMYIISAQIAGSATSNSHATVTSSSSAYVITAVNGASNALSLNGNQVAITQTTGGAATVAYSYIYIPV